MRSVTITITPTKLKKFAVIAFTVAIAVLLTASSCDAEPSTARTESDIQQQNYADLAKSQPLETMDYSPTRETINAWIRTWGKEPGKLSYIYLLAGDGTYLGYYVLKGLPVSYCAMGSPTYVWEDTPNDDNDVPEIVPAPGMDGAYYSGGQCGTYYGIDATTGAYIEYTAGLGINVLLYEEPLPLQVKVEPLGPTSLDDVK